MDKSGKGKPKCVSIYESDGSIWTGYYGNWKSLSKEDHDKVIAKCKCKAGKSKNDRKQKLSELQSLTNDIAVMKCMVAGGLCQAD